MQVNRYLKDKAMDRIDHALGRPLNPLAKTYRDHYAAGADGDIARDMAASPHWKAGGSDGQMQWFFVTREGREALRDHLREIGDRHRLYVVVWDGMEMPCVATSPSKARYRKWLDVSDCCNVSFKDFCRAARVRLTIGGAAAAEGRH
ncbi:hypothetical protein [Paracoccus sp. (in: a-proteobacteria)]|uniref:hypothetical protein n=1 Tax=Paracoccus sp. TaxID=267 RepID=UPI002AFFADDF|nr:hypothetical protein [Paracoccus sp. (in: a-proteobacteria)]